MGTTQAELREARNAFFLMEDEHWRDLAVYGSDKEVEAARFGMQATCAGEFFGNDWLNRLIWC